MFNSALVYELAVLKQHAESLLKSIGRWDRDMVKPNDCSKF